MKSRSSVKDRKDCYKIKLRSECLKRMKMDRKELVSKWRDEKPSATLALSKIVLEQNTYHLSESECMELMEVLENELKLQAEADALVAYEQDDIEALMSQLDLLQVAVVCPLCQKHNIDADRMNCPCGLQLTGDIDTLQHKLNVAMESHCCSHEARFALENGKLCWICKDCEYICNIIDIDKV